MHQEVLSGTERRRRWSDGEKLRIITEASAEGVRLSDVARRHDITRQHIYQWRVELRNKGLETNAACEFVPVELVRHETPKNGIRRSASCEMCQGQHVEIVLRNGRSLRVSADVPEPVLYRLMRIAEAS